jgi:hypothetical protein
MKFDMNVNSIYIRRNGPVVRVDKKYLFILHTQWFEGFRLNVDLTADYVIKNAGVTGCAKRAEESICCQNINIWVMVHFNLGDGRAIYCCCSCWYWDNFVSGAVTYSADIGGRAVEGVGLPPLACRELWVQTLPGAWMSLVSVVHCQVEVSVTGRSLIQRMPTGCGMSECDWGTSKRRSRLTRAVEPRQENKGNLVWYRRVSA